MKLIRVEIQQMATKSHQKNMAWKLGRSNFFDYTRNIGELVMAKFFVEILRITAFFMFTAPASAEEINMLMHPGNRFARENVEIDVNAYWPQGVSVQFLNIEQDSVRKASIGDILFLGSAARADISIIGFPNEMFDKNQRVDPATDVVIFEYDPMLQKNALTENSVIFSDVDTSGANQTISAIIQNGLIEQSSGCFARWRASTSNHIEGFVLAFSASLSEEEKSNCIHSMTPAIFGVSPVVSFYDISNILSDLATPSGVRYFDESETILSIQASAACRFDLKSVSPACPIILINKIFRHHSDILKTFGEGQ